MPKQLAKDFITFCFVGLLNTAISFILLIGLSELTDLHYLFVNIVGHGLAVITGYILHKSITFRNISKQNTEGQFVRFLAVFFIVYLVQLAVVSFSVETLNVYATYAQIVGVALMAVLSFIGNRFYTFSSK